MRDRKAALLRWIPPVLADWMRRRLNLRLRFVGDYASWTDASSESAGYEDAEILRRVQGAMRKVLAGEAAYEQDSVTFAHPRPPFLLLTALLRAGLRGGGRMDVIDFGGALGTLYFQTRDFLADRIEYSWQVLEQKHFVQAGQQEFEDGRLRFRSQVDPDVFLGDVRVAVFSGVLQYLEHPDDAIRAVLGAGATHVVMLRTPLARAERHLLCRQIVPPIIYDASYPMWILSERLLLALLPAGWRLVVDVPADEGVVQTESGQSFEFRNLVFERLG